MTNSGIILNTLTKDQFRQKAAEALTANLSRAVDAKYVQSSSDTMVKDLHREVTGSSKLTVIMEDDEAKLEELFQTLDKFFSQGIKTDTRLILMSNGTSRSFDARSALQPAAIQRHLLLKNTNPKHSLSQALQNEPAMKTAVQRIRKPLDSYNQSNVDYMIRVLQDIYPDTASVNFDSEAMVGISKARIATENLPHFKTTRAGRLSLNKSLSEKYGSQALKLYQSVKDKVFDILFQQLKGLNDELAPGYAFEPNDSTKCEIEFSNPERFARGIQTFIQQKEQGQLNESDLLAFLQRHNFQFILNEQMANETMVLDLCFNPVEQSRVAFYNNLDQGQAKQAA